MRVIACTEGLEVGAGEVACVDVAGVGATVSLANLTLIVGEE